MPRASQLKPASLSCPAAVLERVHARVGPEVQTVPAPYQAVADAEDVPAVQDEHLVRDLEVPHAIVVDQDVDLPEDGLGAPVAVAVPRLWHAAARSPLL